MVSQGKLDNRTLKERFKSWKKAGLGPQQEKVMNKALQSLEKGKVDKNVYNAFNMTLVYTPGDTKGNEITKSFYKHLTSKGYDAIMDLNDKKYSGYGTSKPMIAFNASGKATVDSVRELGINEIAKNNVIGTGAAAAQMLIKQLAPMNIGAGAIAVTSAISSKTKTGKTHDKIVSEYRKEHPNSQLSYNEIIDDYYKKL